MMRSTRLEVDLDAIRHNLRAVRRMLGAGPAGPTPRAPSVAATPRAAPTVASPGSTPPVPPRIAAVLKADGYGLGAVRIAGELLDEGVDMLAVACLPEAIELRRHYSAVPILVMGHTPDEHLGAAVQRDIVVTIFSMRQAEELSRIACARGSKAGKACRATAHVKIDTGMHRLGMVPGPDTADTLARMAALPGLQLEGIFTHLALRDADSDRRQFELFLDVLARAETRGVTFPLRHVCDSIGLMRHPEYRLDMVRVGALLYGVRPLRTPLYEDVDIREAAALKSRIARLARLKEGESVSYDTSWKAPVGGALVATIPAGYADGYKRVLSNKAHVVVRGTRAPVVGLVCMDQLMADVSSVPSVSENDDVLLFGSPPGLREAPPGLREAPPSAPPAARIGLLEIAELAGTNRNEIICSISRRVPRLYIRDGREVGVLDHLAGQESRAVEQEST